MRARRSNGERLHGTWFIHLDAFDFKGPLRHVAHNRSLKRACATRPVSRSISSRGSAICWPTWCVSVGLSLRAGCQTRDPRCLDGSTEV